MKSTDYLTITERAGTSITVMSDSRGPLIVVTDGPGARAARYTPEEAAKFSLAILEAAGYKEDDTEDTTGLTHFALAMSNLRAGIEEQERITAKAEAQAELESEALELLNAGNAESGGIVVGSLDVLTTTVQQKWLAVARRARELAKEATK